MDNSILMKNLNDTDLSKVYRYIRRYRHSLAYGLYYEAYLISKQVNTHFPDSDHFLELGDIQVT